MVDALLGFLKSLTLTNWLTVVAIAVPSIYAFRTDRRARKADARAAEADKRLHEAHALVLDDRRREREQREFGDAIDAKALAFLDDGYTAVTDGRATHGSLILKIDLADEGYGLAEVERFKVTLERDDRVEKVAFEGKTRCTAYVSTAPSWARDFARRFS